MPSKSLFKFLFVLFIFVFPSQLHAANKENNAKEMLSQLDDIIEKRQLYISQRQTCIDSLTSVLKRTKTPSPNLFMEIAAHYTAFNNDSAIAYLERGIEATTGPEQLPFKWKLASLLPLSGQYSTAEEVFKSIDPASVSQQELLSYYEAGRQMYSYVAYFFKDSPEIEGPATAKAQALQSKILEILPKNSTEYKYNLGEFYLHAGKERMAQVLLQEVLAETYDLQLIARAANHLSLIAQHQKNEEDHIYYLALSAKADVEAATREVLSLQQLGKEIYERGDVSRAYDYLSAALANAVECGAPLRMVDASKSLPIIQNAHSDHINKWRRTIYWVIVALIFILVCLIIVALFLRREMNRMAVLQAHLRTANYAKEVYISQFLQLCSIYMDKLNQFCKIATRKLAAGQADELYRMTKSGKFVEEQSSEFYEVFDNAFLHIYPDFVDRVNELLRDDAQLTAPAGRLTTDLRILAFVRLGIEESARIAQILNYSLNTIYAYRNRLKGKAKDKDNFERNILKIDSTV